METKTCNYCNRQYPKSEFKVKFTSKESAYCTVCRDIAESKNKDKDTENFARDMNSVEIELQKRFIKKMKKKEKVEKLKISRGKL